MASTIVLGDAGKPAKRPRRRASRPLGAVHVDDKTGCKCTYNPRTKRWVESCPVPKSRTHRSGWKFTGGACR